MTLLKFVDDASGKSIGAFSWYATHGTSMSRDNKLISGDNKGAAARFFEDWFTSSSTNKSSATSTKSSTTSGITCNIFVIYLDSDEKSKCHETPRKVNSKNTQIVNT